MPLTKREKRGQEKYVITSFKKFIMPFGIIVGVTIFFLSYNTYMVDSSLEDLQFALDQTSKAQGIGDTEKIGILLDDLLIHEMLSSDIGSVESVNMVNLEFAKNVVIRGGVKKQLEDVEFLLGGLVNKREKKRGTLFIAFDRINRDLRKLFKFLGKELPKGASQPEMFKPTVEVDLALLESAKGYEESWQLEKAINTYEGFINKYPAYPELPAVKLRLADSYFKSANYREAKRLYEKIIVEAPKSDEAKIAELLLLKVKNRIAKQLEEKRLGGVISQMVKGGPMQAGYNELSVVDSYLDRLDEETQEMVLYIMEGAEAITKPTVPGVDLTLLDKARLLEDKWLLEQAQEVYEDFIEKYSFYDGIAFVKLLLASAYLKSLQYEKALTLYESVVKDYPNLKEAGFATKLAAKTRDMIKIRQTRQKLIDNLRKFKKTADLAQAHYTLGVTNLYLFDLDKAQELFKKVIALSPGTDLAKRATFNLAWAYKFQAKYDKSIDEFTRFVNQNPNHHLALDSQYYIADNYYKAGRFEEAASSYEIIADKFVDSPLAALSQLQAGYTYLYDLHDPLKAAGAFKKLKSKYPENNISDYAAKTLLPATERSYRDYGFILLKQAKFMEAREAFQNAILIDEADGWAYSGLGTAYMLLALHNEGLEYVALGAEKIPDAYTYAALGFCYDEKKMYKEAIEEYKRSLKEEPKYATSHYNLGRDYLLLGWYDLAMQKFKDTLEIVPAFAPAHNNLGLTYWYKGEFLDAEVQFKEALSYQNDMIEAHYNLAILYEAFEKYRKAAAYLRQALKINPDLEIAKRHLKRLHRRIREDD